MKRRRANARAKSPMDWLEIDSLRRHPRILGLVGSSSAVQTRAVIAERKAPPHSDIHHYREHD